MISDTDTHTSVITDTDTDTDTDTCEESMSRGMMRNSWLVLLPEDFYFQFHYYLLTNDYLQLLHTSKQHYQAIKKKTMYYLLSSGYSYRYVCDTEFRNRLESNVVSPLKQIGLNFRDSVEFPLLSLPLQVHSITFYSSRNLSHEELESALFQILITLDL